MLFMMHKSSFFFQGVSFKLLALNRDGCQLWRGGEVSDTRFGRFGISAYVFDMVFFSYPFHFYEHCLFVYDIHHIQSEYKLVKGVNYHGSNAMSTMSIPHQHHHLDSFRLISE